MNLDLTPPKGESLYPDIKNKVLNLNGDLLAIQPVEKDQKYCLSRHKNIYVDDHLRLIECRECGKIIDPFDYILGWANEGGSRMGRIKDLDAEIKIKSAEVHNMKMAIKREKAKLRRANPEAPELKSNCWLRVVR